MDNSIFEAKIDSLIAKKTSEVEEQRKLKAAVAAEVAEVAEAAPVPAPVKRTRKAKVKDTNDI